MLRTMLDIGTDDAIMSPPWHNSCICRAYRLVEKIDIYKTVTQINVKKMTTMLREKKYVMPNVHTTGGSGLV